MPVTNQKDIEKFYQALVDRDESFVGIFYVGVKTTSIFCIATCRARKPKKENVEFFTGSREAISCGYRPCKICKPTEDSSTAPPPVEQALLLLQEHPNEKITDQHLREKSISPETVRRWFKKHYRMTFQAYQRMQRISGAYQELKAGKNTTQTAFGTGYDSLSGFGYTFKKITGRSPAQIQNRQMIVVNRLTTPLGPMIVCATENGICLLEFSDRKGLEAEFQDLQRLLDATLIAGDNAHMKQAKTELKEYFAGDRKTFGVTLETPGTVFRNQVWNALRQIPYGKTTSYQQQAEDMNRPQAVRAVAAANGCNRIAIIIPCHRVIGKKGNLTGYSGGLERKKWLLAHERKNLP